MIVESDFTKLLEMGEEHEGAVEDSPSEMAQQNRVGVQIVKAGE